MKYDDILKVFAPLLVFNLGIAHFQGNSYINATAYTLIFTAAYAGFKYYKNKK